MNRKLSNKQKYLVAGKAMDLANLTFIGLVISQLIPGPLSNPELILVGILILILTYVSTTIFTQGGDYS